MREPLVGGARVVRRRPPGTRRPARRRRPFDRPRSALDFAAWRPLLALLRRERIDALHAHQFGSNLWAAILGPLAGTPAVIAHEHTWSF